MARMLDRANFSSASSTLDREFGRAATTKPARHGRGTRLGGPPLFLAVEGKPGTGKTYTLRRASMWRLSRAASVPGPTRGSLRSKVRVDEEFVWEPRQVLNGVQRPLAANLGWRPAHRGTSAPSIHPRSRAEPVGVGLRPVATSCRDGRGRGRPAGVRAVWRLRQSCRGSRLCGASGELRRDAVRIVLASRGREPG
jgi:hypothetical protein